MKLPMPSMLKKKSPGKKLEDLKKKIGPNEMPATEKPSSKVDSSFKIKDDTKKINLSEEDPTKETTIGAGLGDK